MNKSSEIQAQLNACRNTQEVRGVINDFCAGFGEIVNVTLLCGTQHPGKTLCVVDFIGANTQTSLCANALGGQVFGFNSVIFNFTPNPDFGCVKGFGAGTPACSCTART